MTNQPTPLAQGDRVVRQRDLYDGHTGANLRRGVVIDCYQGKPNGLGQCLTFYAVQWDGMDYIERGYLRGGLELEPLVIANTK